MRRQDFYYDLPSSLIANQPMPQRSGSRLLCLDGERGSLADKQFVDLLDMVREGDLLVFNDTRVIPARLFGRKESGGRVEVLVERLINEYELLAHVKASKSPKEGAFIVLEDESRFYVQGREGALFKLKLEGQRPLLEVLDTIGHMPLPPYIEREDEESDKERYQTVYGTKPGAVAAPTAGLHFDDALFEKLEQKGVKRGFVTLHVGAGTFQPVRADDIKEHVMHSEWMTVSQALCEQVRDTQANGGRVIAVGTTSVRCLESASKTGEIEPYQGDTDIFIYPGYQFKLVDALVTNFHLPESTLIMLVSAFAGYNNTLSAYRHAVEQQYRFFSYGDAMFIEKNSAASLDLPPSSQTSAK